MFLIILMSSCLSVHPSTHSEISHATLRTTNPVSDVSDGQYVCVCVSLCVCSCVLMSLSLTTFWQRGSLSVCPPSTHPFVCLSVYVFAVKLGVCLCLCPSLSFCEYVGRLSVLEPACLYICRLVCLSVWLIVVLYFYLPVVFPPVCLCLCPSVYFC